MDFYLQERARLQGQPKRTIGDYVESQGVLVPRRFDSLAEARASGKPFIARSEHAQEYDGVSGLLQSVHLPVGGGIDSESQVKEKILTNDPYTLKDCRAYCTYLGLDENQFLRETSFSLWEVIEGYNHAVVADSAVAGRYHIMTTDRKRGTPNYTIIDNGNKLFSKPDSLPPLLEGNLHKLLGLYDAVRNLAHFDRNHCPIVEMQTDYQGQIYFLQYHRTRDFAPSTFMLDRQPHTGEFPAALVRGATSSEGSTIEVTLIPPNYFYLDHEQQREDESFGKFGNNIFSGIMARQRKLHIVPETLEEASIHVAVGHLSRSKLFKPEISVVSPDVLPRDEMRRLSRAAFDTHEAQRFLVHIISDGRTAYLKRV